MLEVGIHASPDRGRLGAQTPDIVPPDIFETAPQEHDGCALVLDGHLRRLARREALCRQVVGRLARSLLQRHGHPKLGFARLGDYTRERLGLSAREVQELARAADGLVRGPAAEVPSRPPPRPVLVEAEPVAWATAPEEATPADVEALLIDVDYLSHFVLDGRLRTALRAMQRIDFQMGHLLRLVADLRLY